MTATELLTTCRAAGILLAADGDSLDVDAPAGALTPALREILARHKAALLAMLAPVCELVTLRGGFVLPLPAYELALDLERRHFRQSVNAAGQYQIEASLPDPSACPTCGRESCEGADDTYCRPAGLTDTDRAAILRWRLHLAAIVRYDADAHAPTQ